MRRRDPRYIDVMATQERAACWECGATYDESPLSPPPTYCSNCSKPQIVIDLNKLRRDVVVPTRPKYVTCRDCGRSVSVRKRGPLPSVCRGGCPPSLLKRPELKKKVRPKRSSQEPVQQMKSNAPLGPADPWQRQSGPVYLSDVIRNS